MLMTFLRRVCITISCSFCNYVKAQVSCCQHTSFYYIVFSFLLWLVIFTFGQRGSCFRTRMSRMSCYKDFTLPVQILLISTDRFQQIKGHFAILYLFYFRLLNNTYPKAQHMNNEIDISLHAQNRIFDLAMMYFISYINTVKCETKNIHFKARELNMINRVIEDNSRVFFGEEYPVRFCF